jgi:hypothetical protein
MLLLVIPVILMTFIAIIEMLYIFYYSFSQIAIGGVISHHSELTLLDFYSIMRRIGLTMFKIYSNAIVVNIRAEANEKKKY